MSQAEDLLNNLSESIPVHDHVVEDPDSYFVIDPDTRQINNISRTLNVIMQYDHDSEVYTFELPRIVEGHDMTLCNVVKVHYNNIDGTTGAENADVFDLYDLHVNPDNEDTVICYWRISRRATQLAGTLSFLLQYLCYASDGETVTYEWHTDIYSDVEVRPGRNNGPQAIINHTDILEQWRAKLFGLSNSEQTKITELSESEQAKISELSESVQSEIIARKESSTQEIINKGAEILETIPTDYTALYNIATSNERKKANAIVCKAEGSSVVVQDSSDDYVRGVRVFGRSEQRTTQGKQLANLPDVNTTTANSVTWSCKNGVVTAKGTSTDISHTNQVSVPIFFVLTGLLPNDTYFVSGDNGNLKMIVSVTKNGTTSYYNNSSFKIDGTETNVRMYCQVAKGVSVDCVAYPMLNAGDTPLPWEPYTGGIASPNPSYPQEIVSLGEVYNYAETNNILGGTAKTANFSEPYEGTVTIAIKPTDGTSQVNCAFEYEDGTTGGDTGIIGTDVANDKWYTKVVTPKKSIVGIMIYNTNASNKRTSEKILIRKGSYASVTDSDYRPYTGVREIGVGVYGRNLIDETQFVKTTTNNYVSFENGKIHYVNSTGASFESTIINQTLPKGKYVLRFYNETTDTIYLMFRINGITIYLNKGNGMVHKFELTKNTPIQVFLTTSNFNTIGNFYVNVMLCEGTTELPYKPYKDPQSLILATPNGLPAIPTTNSRLATYTDADGQMWVADEVDCESGKYVQRVCFETLTSKPNGFFNANDTHAQINVPVTYKPTTIYGLCSHFKYLLTADSISETTVGYKPHPNGVAIFRVALADYPTVTYFNTWLQTNNVQVAYILATPIERDLSAEEIAQYKALRTNKPTTTVLNDCDAHMILEYNADTKTYIDNKFAELQAAILNNAT